MKKVFLTLAVIISDFLIAFTSKSNDSLNSKAECKTFTDSISVKKDTVKLVKVSNREKGVPMLITEYFTPSVMGYVYSKDGYDKEFTVGSIKVFFKKSDYHKLMIEGFIKIVYIDNDNKSHTVYMDSNHKLQPYPKNARNGRLTVGQVACNKYPLGTKLLINGKKYTVTDRGSGVKGVDIYTENYTERSYMANVLVL